MNGNNLATQQLSDDWQKQFKEDFGWAIYRLPDDDKIAFTAGEVTIQGVGDKINPSFIIAPFYSPNQSSWQIEKTINFEVNYDSLSGGFTNLPFYHSPENPESTSQKNYCGLVESILKNIEMGLLEKAVPARVKYIKSDPDFEPFAFYKSILDAYPKAFVYMLSSTKTGTWIGCSPEVLLKVNYNSITTLSLAGTKKIEGPLNQNSKETFTSKELNEQAIVTDYIQGILEKYVSDITTDGPNLIRAGSVYHLATYFKGVLNPSLNGNYGSLIKELHPTPAVCGLPTKDALKILLKQENFDRELYSGFLGQVSENGADLFVNLRCMQVFQNGFKLYAGAGVVEGSDPEKEWFETEEKMTTLLKFL